MPAPEDNGRHQTAVLWRFLRFDRYGEPLVGAPEEVTVRWNWVRRDAKDSKGNLIPVEADVVVNSDIPIYSRMWLGELDDLVGTGTGTSPDADWLYVATFEKTPDVKGRKVFRSVALSRFRDSNH